MTRTFCPQCSFEYTGANECPYCADLGPPAMYDNWRQLATHNAVWFLINIVLSLAVVGVWAMIARGQDRVDYYTLDDGTRVPIPLEGISVRHERQVIQVERKANGRYEDKPSRPMTSDAKARQYRPAVRQSPFQNTTRTISARVAAKANLSLTDGLPTVNTSINARVAGSRGDTNP